MSILLAHAVSPSIIRNSQNHVRARKAKGIIALHRMQQMIGLSDSELLECYLSLTTQHHCNDSEVTKHGN